MKRRGNRPDEKGSDPRSFARKMEPNGSFGRRFDHFIGAHAAILAASRLTPVVFSRDKETGPASVSRDTACVFQFSARWPTD